MLKWNSDISLFAVAVVVCGVAPAGVSAVPCYGVPQPFCTYPNNPGAMIDDIGPLRLGTTFETWPDGSPTHFGQQLTASMNYTDIGVTFSSPIGNPFIAPLGQFKALEADSGGTFEPDWIIADFVTPASAVGIYFPGGTTLWAYDSGGNIIASVTYEFPGNGNFLGITSDVPIARATVDYGSNAELVDTFAFKLIPEPSIVAFLGAGLAGIARPRRR